MNIDKDFANDIVKLAIRAGATDADVIIRQGSDFSATVRLGDIEKLEQAHELKVGLRVFVGKRSAITSSANLQPAALEKLAAETVSLAKIASEDEMSGLPEGYAYASEIIDLRLYHSDVEQLSAEHKIRLAKETERAALDFDPRITNSEGAECSSSVGKIVYANSHGFAGEYRSTTASLSVVPVARENGQMQRDYWYTAKRSFARLEPAQQVGRRAAERALRRLGARKIKTQVAPVVFDQRTATNLLSHLCEAVSGTAIYRKSSFLVDKLGKKVAADIVNIEDDGRIPEGLGSRPFDAEGLPTQRTLVMENGVLLNYLLDCYSARKLGLRSTANAVRGPAAAGPPSVGPNNFFLRPGALAPEEVIRSVNSGLYVTELIGFGVNIVNGNYSQGAVGIWIEKGELAFPVEEITIAGNLAEMLMSIEMVASDLEFHGPVASPTIKIAKMVISGT